VKAWLGVVSRAHVRRGVAGGFAQLCHGKAQPLRRMQGGDWLVYYSPTLEMGGAPLRAFTAIGRVEESEVYSHDMGAASFRLGATSAMPTRPKSHSTGSGTA